MKNILMYLNTSHVKVNLFSDMVSLGRGTNLNTSHVKVNR